MGFDKHTVFSIILLIFFFAAGFVVNSFTVSSVWECKNCNFDNGEVIPVVNDEYFDVLINEINNAEDSIHIVMYSSKFYETNNSVRQIEDALNSAVKRGVDVKIILDHSTWSGRITSVSKNNEIVKEYLEENGVEVKFDSLKKTTHVKMIVIDGKIVLIGSTNWTYSALERNNEANVLIKDLGIAEYFGNYFDFLWKS